MDNNKEMIEEINNIKKTTSLIVLGMAGSGKTTFVQVLMLLIIRNSKRY